MDTITVSFECIVLLSSTEIRNIGCDQCERSRQSLCGFDHTLSCHANFIQVIVTLGLLGLKRLGQERLDFGEAGRHQVTVGESAWVDEASQFGRFLEQVVKLLQAAAKPGITVSQ